MISLDNTYFYFISGNPTISSRFNSLSGELCPGRVTFSCNSLETASPIIDYYVNNVRLVRYEYELTHMFPLMINASLPELTVQITSATTDSNNMFSFTNFTMSAELNYLHQYQGQNLTCGTIIQRSNPIYIGKFVLTGKCIYTLMIYL